MGVSLRHQWHDTIWGGVISPRRPRLFMICYELTWPICICLWGGVWMHPRLCLFDMIYDYDMLCLVTGCTRPVPLSRLVLRGLSSPYTYVLTDMWLCVWDLFEYLVRSARGFLYFFVSIRVARVDKPLLRRTLRLWLLFAYIYIWYLHYTCLLDLWYIMHIQMILLISFAYYYCFVYISVHWAF